MARGLLARRLFARRFHVTNVIAVVCHLLALAFVATREAPRRPPPAPPPEDSPIAVEIDTEPPPSPPPPAATQPEPLPAAPAPANTPAPRKALPAAPALAGNAGTAGSPGSTGDGLLDAPPASLGAPAAPASAAPTAIPDGLPPPLIPRAIRAPAAALEAPLLTQSGPAPTSATAQVMATVQKAAETSGPRQGHATIRITVDEDGTVSGVSVSGAGWEGVVQAIRAALAGRRIRVPKGARGVVIAFTADAAVTRVPPVLTGEAKAQPMHAETAAGKGPPTDDEHRGFHPAAPNMAVIDYKALLPAQRRVVKLQPLGEQPR